MSDTKLVSPLLDGFTLGAPISNRSGICCCPGMKENSDNKYIVKIIAVPASQTQLDALLVTGAYKDPAAALDYFRGQADAIAAEAELLKKLSRLDGFLAYDGWQVAPMRKNRLGYYVYLVSEYKRSLEKFMRRHSITQLETVNMALDMCSALSMCRQAGYIYADLKPTNIFVGDDGTYRICDLGFVALDSLRYSSLPEKYISPYSAPETHDVLFTLNETMDTYALGMILYRIYNGGKLPEMPKDPAESLPAPAYADEEMANIILKACNPQADQRWNNPADMGKALVAYMQSNPVDDVPVAPDTTVEQAPVVTEDPVAAQETMRFTPTSTESAPEQHDSNLDKTILAPVSFQEAAAMEAVASEPASAEADADEDVSVAESLPIPEMIPETTPENAVTVNEAVPPADEADKAGDEPAPEQDDQADLFDLDSELAEVNNLLKTPSATEKARAAAANLTSSPVVYDEKPHRGKKLLAALLVVLLLAAIGFCGFTFYQFFYLKNVESLAVEGSQDRLTVTVKTDASESLLSVSCVDLFGNSQIQPVSQGKAVFTDLNPDSMYKIAVEVSGLHKLVGHVSEVFTTEAQTEVISFSAITGQEDGSALLTLTVHGHEPQEWVVTCTSEGEPTVSETIKGHSGTVKGLTLGKTYTITLSAGDGSTLLGQTTVEYTASGVISANNLSIISRINGELTVCWEEPTGHPVESWDVRCYGEGFDQTQTVTGTLAIFTGTTDENAYTVEITAAGMTQPTRTSVSSNPVTIQTFTVDDSVEQELNLKWEYAGKEPSEGWLLLYTMDGSEISNVVKCPNAAATISPRVPGASYQFTIQTTDGTSVFNGIHTFQCSAGSEYNGHAISAQKITSILLPTPEEKDWTADNADRGTFTNVFTSGQKISIILEAGISFYLENEDTNVLYVIRDANGKVIPNLVEQIRSDWHDLWSAGDYHYCELNVPNTPSDPGDYRIDVYFNGASICSNSFTIK